MPAPFSIRRASGCSENCSIECRGGDAPPRGGSGQKIVAPFRQRARSPLGGSPPDQTAGVRPILRWRTMLIAKMATPKTAMEAGSIAFVIPAVDASGLVP